jgi:hypothetical protein
VSSTPLPRALALLDDAVLNAVRQSRLAYEFSPNSYTYGSFTGCLAAQNTLGMIRARLSMHIDAIE